MNEPLLPTAAKRGLVLIGEEKWVDALSVLSALLNQQQQQQQQQPDTTPDGARDAHTTAIQCLMTICERKLGLQFGSSTTTNVQGRQGSSAASASRPAPFKLPMPAAKVPLTNSTEKAAADVAEPAASYKAADDTSGLLLHPLQYLTAALQCTASSNRLFAKSRTGSRIGVGAFRQQRQAEAQAVGLALAFLLHPMIRAADLPDSQRRGSGSPDSNTGSLAGAVAKGIGRLLLGSNGGSASGGGTFRANVPDAVINAAADLLDEHGKSAFGAAALSLSLAGGAASAIPGSTSSLANWDGRAGSRKSLQDLAKLTGLEPIKQQMLNLADEVRPLSKTIDEIIVIIHICVWQYMSM
jgi:hypothetical protein